MSFCEAVMLQKEFVERDREITEPARRRRTFEATGEVWQPRGGWATGSGPIRREEEEFEQREWVPMPKVKTGSLPPEQPWCFNRQKSEIIFSLPPRQRGILGGFPHAKKDWWPDIYMIVLYNHKDMPYSQPNIKIFCRISKSKILVDSKELG